MEKPILRWIEALPILHEGSEMILLRDTEGIAEKSLVVSKNAAFLLSMMDGTRTVADIQAAYMKASGELIRIEQIQQFVVAMDSNLFLMSDKFTRHFTALKEEYNRAAVRIPCCAGSAYPAETHDLLAFLDGIFSESADTEAEDVKIDEEITGILAPHIDYGRGKAVYRATYRYLKNVNMPLIVLLGTSHNNTDKLLNISLKDFSTPLGVIPHSPELIGLIRANKALEESINEWPHRGEHSIELQLPMLQFMAAGAPFEILPILTGSMHQHIAGEKGLDEDELTASIEGLKEVLKAYGKPYLIISGADLAHIGSQFGDKYTLDQETLAKSKEKDESIIIHIKNVDGEGFFREIQSEADQRRICGLTPIFIQLRLLEHSQCRIVGYDQWCDGKSSVSFAGGIFYSSSPH
ncbi:MAG: AmmeMemoRadiSam system protein B [Syntrophus sp. (in: bacteria)]|nr:AmmeMemoRadiSam system protein B [Syntrophus sp. (in: bacteria)]